MEANSNDIVLEEEIDDNYTPTEEELLEYATWLGMDLLKHNEFLWIAKEGLISPLPDDWKPCLTEEDEIYYFNFVTGESLWDHPCDEFYRNLYKEKVKELSKHQEDCQQPFQLQRSQRAVSNHIQARHQQSDGAAGSTCLSGLASQLEQNASQMHQEKRGVGMSKKMAAASQQFSGDLMTTLSTKGFRPESKSFSVSSFPVEPLYHRNRFVTRSLPVSQIFRMDRDFIANGACVSSYLSACNSTCNPTKFQITARTDSTGNRKPPSANVVRAQELAAPPQPQKYDVCCSGLKGTVAEEQAWKMESIRQGVDAKVRQWVQEEENRLIEARCKMHDRIQAKILEEERIVLQQERIEMIERVGQVVQEEECQILESLQQEMVHKVEKQVENENETILANRRNEMQSEIEIKLQNEKNSLEEVQRQQLEEGKIQVNKETRLKGKPQDELQLSEEHKALEEQLKADRESQRDDLRKLLKEERDLFESEKQRRLQELKEILKEEESRLMEKERQETLKKVNKEIQEEELILFEKMKADMVARIKQKVKTQEKSTFEKEHQLLVKRVKEEVEQKHKELQDKFEKEVEAQLSMQKESLLKQQKDKILRTIGKSVEHEVQMETRQANFQKGMANLESGLTAEEIQKKTGGRLNVLRDTSKTCMMQREVDLKKQVLQFIADFKEGSLRQKIKEEISNLIREGVLLGNMKIESSNKHQETLQMDLDSVHQDAIERDISIADTLKTILNCDEEKKQQQQIKLVCDQVIETTKGGVTCRES